MIKIILILILISQFSCNYNESEIKVEYGKVIQMTYVPPIEAIGGGSGISTSGNVVVTNSYLHGKEKYAITIKCEHNEVFSVNSKNDYAKIEVGDSIKIFYTEITIDSNLVRYDFKSLRKVEK